MKALAADPRNPVALKNLGAILGKEGDSLRALYYLRRSFEIDPQDPQTVYGLAFAYMELGDMEPAQKHFQAVLEMEAPEELRSLARDGLSKIAARKLKARGPRMDAVFYPAGRCGSFAGGRCRRFRRSPSRSACWGNTGWISMILRRATSCGRCRGVAALGAGQHLHGGDQDAEGLGEQGDGRVVFEIHDKRRVAAGISGRGKGAATWKPDNI